MTSTCDSCGQELRVGDWPFCPHGRTLKTHHAVHSSERSVVYQHPLTGEIKYPGRNDAPMPTRYARQGYERRELPSLNALRSFEREAGVQAEVAHFDKGTGHGFDTADVPGITSMPEGIEVKVHDSPPPVEKADGF